MQFNSDACFLLIIVIFFFELIFMMDLEFAAEEYFSNAKPRIVSVFDENEFFSREKISSAIQR